MNSPIRILLVDDNLYFLEITRLLLHLHRSFEVAGTATEGREALARARQCQPDVILVDLSLGSQSGLRLIPLFKRHLPLAKIIVVSVMEESKFRPRALRAGADDFVDKLTLNRMLVPAILRQMGCAAGESARGLS